MTSAIVDAVLRVAPQAQANYLDAFGQRDQLLQRNGITDAAPNIALSRASPSRAGRFHGSAREHELLGAAPLEYSGLTGTRRR